MSGVQIVALGIVLLVSALFLIVAVLMQSGKSHNLSGTIAGGAETFFGKTKGKTIDKMLGRITTIVSICFTILVIVVYVIQPETATNTDDYLKQHAELEAAETSAEEQVTLDEGEADLNATADTTAAE